MEETLLHDELIFLDYEADNREDLLRKLASELKERGYVKESYIKGVLDREKVFPTGLNTAGVKVALPHTDAIHVNKAAIAVAKLKKPIIFKEMGFGEKDVEAKLIIMMAVRKPEDQVKTLSKLMSILSDEKTLTKLYNCTEKSEVIAILNKVLYESDK